MKIAKVVAVLAAVTGLALSACSDSAPTPPPPVPGPVDFGK